MSFTEVVDQKIWNRLHQQIVGKNWATTYLFTGKEEERKKALAIQFAKALNCEGTGRPTVTGEASSCNCSTCRRIEAGTHPDVKWYGQDEEANSIKISEVRDFRNWLSLKPFEGKVKVFIFNRAERLTSEAQNALLKSLEEPPADNVILLLVSHSKTLFDTITSRAFEIKVPPFSSKAIREILIQRGVEDGEAEVLARMSQGNLNRALKANEDQWLQEKNLWIDQLVRDPISFLDQFQGAGREEVSRVLDFLIEWARDLLIYRAGSETQTLIHVDRLSLIQSVTQGQDFDSVLELFEGLEQIKKSIDDYGNQKLALTETAIQLERFFHS